MAANGTASTFLTWKDFGNELKNRFNSFWKHPIMVLYLIFIVAFIGSSGVWLPFVIFDTSDKCFDIPGTLSIGLSTYCIAILSATMSDQLLSPSDTKRTIRFFTFGLFAISYTIAYIASIKKNSLLGFVTVIISFLLWIITYSTDSSKQDESNPMNPQGGDVAQTQLSGSTEGFTS